MADILTLEIKNEINNKFLIKLKPCDTDYADKVFTCLIQLEDMHKECINFLRDSHDGAAEYAYMKNCDHTMRELIDGTFGQGLCDILFGEPLDAFLMFRGVSGTPLWVNLILPIIERIEIEPPKRCRKIIKKYKRAVRK